MAARMKVVIVGGAAGGATTAARLRRRDESADIVLFGRGEHVSFANCALTQLGYDAANVSGGCRTLRAIREDLAIGGGA